MPARQPFTALCQATARRRGTGRSDLHLHSTHSDGTYTPAQLVELAGRCGLSGLAVTDHDTLSGVAPARVAAAGSALEVIAGVEVSAERDGHEFHLLGYFVRLDNAPLLAALARLRAHRTDRFWDMVGRLRGCGVTLDEDDLRRQTGTAVLGRRHLAEFLVQTRWAGSVREAFARYLHDGGRAAVPKQRLPVAEAIALVRGAGGVAAWAHPSYDGTREVLAALRRLGLQAIEVEYPGFRPGRGRRLRAWAAELGLAVTGGSDCHGPDHPRRTVGVCGVTAAELDRLRQLSTGSDR
jgi:predicted metal-dependent phosphoesterase TrpH